MYLRHVGQNQNLDSHVTGGPEGEEKEQEARSTEIRLAARGFPNLIKDISKHIPEAQGAPDKVNTKKATPRHITGELLKIKHKERHSQQPDKRDASLLKEKQ